MIPKILLVDDEPDIRDVLKLTLSEEKYEIHEASNGEEAMQIINAKPMDLLILDYNMPKMNGLEVLKRVRTDLLLRHLPIIMLTGKSEVEDKIAGLDAGADDYLIKPFEPKELVARLKMILKRSERDLEANPLSRLPGNISILNELSSRINTQNPFAVCYIDLNKFKAYNDKYGFEHGDSVIKETARILIRAVQTAGTAKDFIGHIGGDDFVIITDIPIAEKIAVKIIDDFDKVAPTFYNEIDRTNNYIVAFDRQGKEQKFALLSIAIGIVTNEFRALTHAAQIGEIGAELKEHAKRFDKSTCIRDHRKNTAQ